MPFEFFLAFRHLRSHRNRRLSRATALAAIGGIALGVGSLIVAMALANGFRDEMRDKILRGTAHVTVMRADRQTMPDYEQVAARIRQLDGVQSAVGTTYDGGVAIGPKGLAYVVLRGIDRESVPALPEGSNWLSEGSFAPLFEVSRAGTSSTLSVVLGADLAARTGVGVGDVVELFPAEMGLISPVKRVARVAGTFRSGLFEYDSAWIYLSLETSAILSGGDHAASAISVRVKDLDDVKPIAAKVRNALGAAFTAVDWQEANRPLFAALALERRMGIFIIGLIIFAATINITTMLILVVVERRRDIAILNAMGATSRSIMLLFVIEGAIVGLLGTLGGVLAGALVCVVGNRYKLVSLPADVYSISSVPFNLYPNEVLLAALTALTLSILATVYPSWAAARLPPAETLRSVG